MNPGVSTTLTLGFDSSPNKLFVKAVLILVQDIILGLSSKILSFPSNKFPSVDLPCPVLPRRTIVY
jgi:hypothetical protein